MGLFDVFRGKGEANATPIYAFAFEVRSGQTKIPSPMIGAWVLAYALGDGPTEAAENAVNELRAMGYVVTDMKTTGGQLIAGDWDKHVCERWPEFVGHFPKQDDVLSVLARENAIFGPFAGFEQQH